jgi:hypothetical protein
VTNLRLVRESDDREYHGRHRADGWQPSVGTKYDIKVKDVIKQFPNAISGTGDGDPERGDRFSQN